MIYCAEVGNKSDDQMVKLFAFLRTDFLRLWWKNENICWKNVVNRWKIIWHIVF
ncbi:unnamed protein product [Acanthoscelides obtectus]|uniref:Uncharacterized protein n=1 Tax=Acanthoscelides obtectus TaxID=200917 RepID=A0A9P0KDC8_ACAOB|nr:unnamed protein product [Acanthoscelides obtectus]CAK1647634.1 hypothetical protein AOBTE_LOCUS15313 [Acanthoscelides obtectus]